MRLRLLLACLLALALPAADPGGGQEADASTVSAESPLHPVKTDSPRDTMRSFMHAMDNRVRSMRSGDGRADAWLADAVRCFDLSQTQIIGRDATGRDSAVLLKEVIDRVIVIDYERIPDRGEVDRWRLRGTEISIRRMDQGEFKGEYLFTSETVARARDFHAKVKDLPLLPGTLGGGLMPLWQESYIPTSFKREFFGVAYWQWVLIGALIFVGLLVRQVVRMGGYLLMRVTERTAATWDDDLLKALTGPATHLGTTGIWFASLHLIGVTGVAYTVLTFLIKGAFFINLAYLAYKLAGFVGNVMERRVQERQQDFNRGLLRLIKQTLKLLALLFCLLLGAQNMGMDVASLIAGLGIGGLAFALAAKDTLANLFGSVMIMIDRPFQVGDWIIVKGSEGTVEQIGFRSTRIRTFYNSVISIPNSELVLANIDNMGMRDYRRVVATLGLTYDTPPERIEAFCEGIKNAIKANPHTRKDYIQVCFNGYGAASLDIMVYFFLKVPDWAEELVQRQNVYLEILRLAETVGVRFAYPTQTLHIESTPDHPAPAPVARDREALVSGAVAFGPAGAVSRPGGSGIFVPRHREPA